MKIVSNICVNSNWVARFLAAEHQECCECFGECKVKVENEAGYIYVLTELEIENLKAYERNKKISVTVPLPSTAEAEKVINHFQKWCYERRDKDNFVIALNYSGAWINHLKDS